jgi:hypothetical protein
MAVLAACLFLPCCSVINSKYGHCLLLIHHGAVIILPVMALDMRHPAVALSNCC